MTSKPLSPGSLSKSPEKSCIHSSLPAHPLAPRPSRRALFTIFGIALLARLTAMWSYITSHPWNRLYAHPWEMGLVANSLLHGLGYSSPFGGSTGPTAFIAPGYPTIIAAIFLVFGSFSHASVIVILLMHIAFSLLTIALIMFVACNVLDARTATLAGAFWAISLPLLWVPEIFWESTLSECALIGVIALAVRYRCNITAPAWILVGAISAVATLINPALIFSLIAVMAWLAWQHRTHGWKAPLTGLLTFLMLFSVWPIRNACRFHAFIPLRSTVGFELWMGNRPGATGRLDDSVFLMTDLPERARYLAMGEVAYTHDKSQQAWAYIHAHPTTFADITLRRIYRFWAGTGNIDPTHIYETHALLTTLFGFAGLVLVFRKGWRSFAVLMALPLLLFPAPYYITHAEFRYRLNVDPILTVLAAYAITQLASRFTRKAPKHNGPSQ